MGFGIDAESLGAETLNAETGKGVEIRAKRVDGISPSECEEAGGTGGVGGRGIETWAGGVGGVGAGAGTTGETGEGIFGAAGRTSTGGGKSTRDGGTDTSRGGAVIGEAGGCAGFSADAGTVGSDEAICFLSSAISRRKDLYCLSCSSLRLSRPVRSLPNFKRRKRVRNGVITNKIPKMTSSGMV